MTSITQGSVIAKGGYCGFNPSALNDLNVYLATSPNNIPNAILFDLLHMTADSLMQSQDELRTIKWTEGEANIDTGFSKLACSCCETAWKKLIQEHTDFKHVEIECHIPDINIKFTFPNGDHVEKKIELKQSKSTIIPGSTIGQLDINMPLIWCLRKPDCSSFRIRCSQYHQAMISSDTDLFQNRKPRPMLNFESMGGDNVYEEKEKEAWVEHYGQCAINRIESGKCRSWQDHMMQHIKKIIIYMFIKNTSIEEFTKMKEDAN